MDPKDVQDLYFDRWLEAHPEWMGQMDAIDVYKAQMQ